MPTSGTNNKKPRSAGFFIVRSATNLTDGNKPAAVLAIASLAIYVWNLVDSTGPPTP